MSAKQIQMEQEGIPTATLERAINIIVSKVRAMSADDILTRTEAAAYLKISPNHFDKLVAAGKFKSHHIYEKADPRYIRSELLESMKVA